MEKQQSDEVEELAVEAAEERNGAGGEQLRHSEIIVNGRKRTISGDIVSFDEVVKLAFPAGASKPNTKFTVTYRNAAQVPAMGEMDPGQTVKVKPGRERENETIFNVTETVLS